MVRCFGLNFFFFFFARHHFVFVDIKYFFCATQTFIAYIKHFFHQHQLVFVDTRLLFVKH